MRIILLLLFCSNVLATDIVAKIDRVYDGDTAMFNMPGLPPELSTLSVRLSGIDTAEMHGKCTVEKTLAKNAKLFLQNRIEGKIVTLKDCTWDKYGSRIDCTVWLNGTNINKEMLDNHYAIPYNGTKKTMNWCKL